jgi:integrase
VAQWFASLSHYSETTRRHALKALRQVLEHGVDCGYISSNAARRFRLTRGPRKRTTIRPFESWDEVEAVAVAAGHYGPLIRFACATGLRPQEWAALEWRDVNFSGRTVSIRRTLQAGAVTEGIAKTDASLRTVLLQRRALDVLRELPRPLQAERPLFTDAKGNRINPTSFRRNVFDGAVEAAELKKRSPKDMRHTFATLTLAADCSLAWVSKQLGHTDIKTTLDFYIRWLPVIDERELTKLDLAGHVSPVGRAEATDA